LLFICAFLYKMINVDIKVDDRFDVKFEDDNLEIWKHVSVWIEEKDNYAGSANTVDISIRNCSVPI
jgi:hypothetical protein